MKFEKHLVQNKVFLKSFWMERVQRIERETKKYQRKF